MPWLVQLRRMLGLYAFFYVLMHFLTWLILDQGLYWSGIVEDIGERPFITIGFTALLLLVPLAVTSTNKMMRRLGKRWKSLHRLIYAICLLAVWHYYWQVKADVTEPLIYLAIVLVLLGWRAWKARPRLRARASGGGGPRGLRVGSGVGGVGVSAASRGRCLPAPRTRLRTASRRCRGRPAVVRGWPAKVRA